MSLPHPSSDTDSGKNDCGVLPDRKYPSCRADFWVVDIYPLSSLFYFCIFLIFTFAFAFSFGASHCSRQPAASQSAGLLNRIHSANPTPVTDRAGDALQVTPSDLSMYSQSQENNDVADGINHRNQLLKFNNANSIQIGCAARAVRCTARHP